MFLTIQQRIDAVIDGQTDTLNLSHFDLTELPDAVYNLRSLRVLIVCNVLLQSFQQTIDMMHKLGNDENSEILKFLEENEHDLQQDLLVPKQLQTLDSRIGQLRALEILDLGYNQLTSLPDSLGTLPALRQLILNDNQLTHVPASLAQLPNLELLDLRHNPLRSPPVLPQLDRYTAYKEHVRNQKNEALRTHDYDLSVWFRKKETSYGLVL